MPDPISQTAFHQVIVTTPTGDQVLVRRWLATGTVEVDWRRPGETWTPLQLTTGSFREEVQQ